MASARRSQAESDHFTIFTDEVEIQMRDRTHVTRPSTGPLGAGPAPRLFSPCGAFHPDQAGETEALDAVAPSDSRLRGISSNEARQALSEMGRLTLWLDENYPGRRATLADICDPRDVVV